MAADTLTLDFEVPLDIAADELPSCEDWEQRYWENRYKELGPPQPEDFPGEYDIPAKNALRKPRQPRKAYHPYASATLQRHWSADGRSCLRRTRKHSS